MEPPGPLPLAPPGAARTGRVQASSGAPRSSPPLRRRGTLSHFPRPSTPLAMKLRPLPALVLTLFALAGVTVAAQQTLEKIPEPDFVRETVIDDQGYQQFAPYDVKCEACRGLGTWTCAACEKREGLPACTVCGAEKGTPKEERKAPCRLCAGTRKLLDPLIELPCTHCQALAWYPCAQCGGAGVYYETRGEHRTELPCRACDQKGYYPCNVCEQERKVPTYRFKRDLPTEAELDDLQEARGEVAGWLAELEVFEPLDRASKTQKAMEKMLARAKRDIPQLDAMLELLDEVQSGLSKVGAGYQNYEERQNFQFLIFRNRSVHLLRHDLRALDQCIQRAEYNEKVDEKK